MPQLIGISVRTKSLTGLASPSLLTPEGLKKRLAELFDLAVRGELKATISATYPLERADDADRALEERGTTVKVVLVP